MENAVVLVLFGAAALVFLVYGIREIVSGVDFMGNPPIGRGRFLIGKMCMFASWAFLPLQAAGVNLAWFPVSAGLRWAGIAALSFGVIFTALSFLHLGASNRMGLPDEETELRTSGIYRISRNPMYVGFFLTGLASCLYAPHPVNFALLTFFVLIHHQIVIAEEEFLIRRFKEGWLEYRFRVRRYL